MKLLQIVVLPLLLCLFYHTASAQNIAQAKVLIEKSSGKIQLLDEKGADLQAVYKIVSMEVDVFDNGNQYAGSISVQGDKFPLAEVKKEETLKVNTLKVQEISSGKALESKNNVLQWK
jgi:hypothetical protein